MELGTTPSSENTGNTTNTGGNNTGKNTGGNTQKNTIKSNPSTNAYLKSLQLDVEGISPKFNTNVFQYYIIVPNSVNSINVNAVPEHNTSKVTIDGNRKINVGLNKISILVIAEDGKTKRTYTVNVTKTDDPGRANANLENLAIEKCMLVPEFNTDITEYTCELEEDLSQLNILAIPQYQNAKVEIIGNQDLQIGENSILVNVTAQDGITLKKYTVKVNKKQPELDYKDEQLEQPLQEEKVEESPKQVNKNGAAIPLSIAGVVAIIAGICYKKFVKK